MSALSAAAQDEDGDTIKNLQARVADLEAQLYAVGAGGVGSTVARQDHPEQHLDMVPAGWKLVPVEPTEEMRDAGKDAHYEAETRTSDSDAWSLTGFAHRAVRASYVYRAMLAAAPQPPVVEQEPVAWAEEIIEYLHAHYDTEMIKELDSGDALIRLDDAIAAVEEVVQRYPYPQPPRQPLTDAQINDHRLALPYDGEDLPDPWDFKQGVRAAERAHRIGGEA